MARKGGGKGVFLAASSFYLVAQLGLLRYRIDKSPKPSLACLERHFYEERTLGCMDDPITVFLKKGYNALSAISIQVGLPT